jgi:hypothetical protein
LSAAGDRVSLGPIDLPRIVIQTGDITVSPATIGGAA